MTKPARSYTDTLAVVIVCGGIIAGCFAGLAFMMLDAFVRGGV